MPCFFAEEDIDGMMDAAVPIYWGAIAACGFIDTPDELLLDNGARPGVIGSMVAVTIKTNDFPGLAIDAELMVDGVPYVVRSRLREGDGAMTRLLCEKVR